MDMEAEGAVAAVKRSRWVKAEVVLKDQASVVETWNLSVWKRPQQVMHPSKLHLTQHLI
jgi:hypothetical protein